MLFEYCAENFTNIEAALRGTRNETAMRAGYAGCPKTK